MVSQCEIKLLVQICHLLKGSIQNLLTAVLLLQKQSQQIKPPWVPPSWILSNRLQISMSQHWFSVITCAKSPVPLMASDKPNCFHWRGEQITAGVSELS